MKILLDESVPVQVGRVLQNHEVYTLRDMGWRGVSNGEMLLAASQNGFDLVIIADKNLRYQQNLTGLEVSILELWTNHRPTLERHLGEISAAVERISSGEYFILENPEKA